MRARWVKAIFIGGASLLVCFAIVAVVLAICFPIKYRPYITKYARESQVEPCLVASIIRCESGYNRRATSSKGALGLMQLMPSTAARFYDGELDEELLFDPETNIRLGTALLGYLLDKYGDEVTVLACYNAGEAAARKWMDESGVVVQERISFAETANYVKRVLRAKKFYGLVY